MKRHREGLLMLGIFVLALLVRVQFAWPVLIDPARPAVFDEVAYYGRAISLLETGRLLWDGAPSAVQMPLFPLALAPIYYLLGPAVYAPQPFIVVLSALTCVGVYILGREMFRPLVGVVAAIIMSLDRDHAWYGSRLLTETLIVFLALCGLMALERLRVSQRWQTAVIAGSLLALATLTRANFGPFVPFALAWVVYSGRARLWPAVRNALIVAGLVGSMWSVWIVRNYAELGAFIPFTTTGGQGYSGIYNDFPNRKNLLYYRLWYAYTPPSVPTDRQLSEVELDRYHREYAVDWIRAHPVEAVEIALLQAVHLWQPEFKPPTYLLLLPVAFIGFVLAVRQGNQKIVLWAILAVVLTVMAMGSVGVSRYRLPLHPALAVWAAFAVVSGWEWCAAWWRPRRPSITGQLEGTLGRGD